MISKWFSRGRRPVDKQRQSSKKNARKSVTPLLEFLEVRLAPAVVNLVGSELDLTASTSVAETITVTAPSPNTLDIAVTTATGMTHTISLQGGAATDTKDFVLNPNQTFLQISNVNTTGPQILISDVFLPNSTSSDTLNFGLANNTGINNVSISGPSLTTTDTNDTVTLNSLSIPGNLVVSGGTISFPAGNTVDAFYMALTSANAITLSSSLITTDLNVSAETINFQGTVDIPTMTLTSVNSLIFPSTGVPYLGAITPNAAPATGQPFAGYTYITGPDWGVYGYSPGDEITINGATGVSPMTDYTVQAIVGDNLYLTPALPSSALPPTAITDGDVTVAPANFTPELEGSSLSLNVTGQGSSISGAIEAQNLDATTQDGNITLQNVGGAGAKVSFTAVGGEITSVTPTPAAGGSGYLPNSTFDLV